MRQQKITSKVEKRPIVINNKTPNVPEQPILDPQYANKPVRMVNYVEIGDMTPAQVHLMLQELITAYDSARGGIHYFIPVRNGKLRTDVAFEAEIEKFGEKIFEAVDENGQVIPNAKLQLKGGAKEVVIIRQTL